MRVQLLVTVDIDEPELGGLEHAAEIVRAEILSNLQSVDYMGDARVELIPLDTWIDNIEQWRDSEETGYTEAIELLRNLQNEMRHIQGGPSDED